MITKIKAGDRLQDPKPINRIIDAVNSLGEMPGDSFPGIHQSGVALTVYNDTGRDLEIGDLFPYFSPSAHPFPDAPLRLTQGTMIVAKMPVDTSAVEWGICGEKIISGYSGVGFLSGVILARIQTDSSTDASLDIDATGDWWRPKRGASGPATLLWIADEATGDGTWALIKLGGGGGAAGSIKLVQAQADGSSGTVSVKEISMRSAATDTPNFDPTGSAYNLRYLRVATFS